MTAKELLKILDDRFPLSMAMSWDNVGLLVGRGGKEITRVMIAVDATGDVVEQALTARADLLLTHHPLIFGARKTVEDEDFVGKRLVKLIQGDISVIALHTNYDVCGMAEGAASRMDLQNAEVLEVTTPQGQTPEGIGRVGSLPLLKLTDLAEEVKSKFNLDRVRVFGQLDRAVSRVAISPGSGGSMIREALEKGAEVLITGDIDHHEGMDAVERGLCIVDAGHFGLEQIFAEDMEVFLHQTCPDLQVLKACEKAPFVTV